MRNPRTGGIDFTFTPTTAEEIARKAARLRVNQTVWAARPIKERVGIMRRWIGELAAHAKAIGAADGADTGGCHTSQFTAFIAIANISGWCEDAEGVLERAHVSGQAITMPTVQIRSQLVPYPLVGVISPWNAPMMLSLLDAVPALFAGSAVLLKPSEVTPRFVEPLMHTVQRVPELAEVFDVVFGDGRTGQDVIAQVDLVCFTGSVPTGRKVAAGLRRAADSLLPGNGWQGSGHRHRQCRHRSRHYCGAARRRLCHRPGVLFGGARVCARVHPRSLRRRAGAQGQSGHAQRQQSAGRPHRPVHLRAPAGNRAGAPG